MVPSAPLPRRHFLQQAAAGLAGALCPILGFGANADGASLPVVKPEYFGLHMAWPTRRPYADNYPSVPVGSWRAILPELHWFSLEPSPGEWKFDKFDIAMRLMDARRIETLYTLGETPAWASSEPTLKGPYVAGQLAPPKRLADWENYVRTVAERYRGRIRAYELWNEPPLREIDGSRAHFTAGQMVELGMAAYRIIKAIDPEARLTTPAMVGGEKGAERLDAYFAAGGGRCTDIVAFHYYGLPEQIPQYHAAIRKVMAKHRLDHLPVWNTEFGFLIADPDVKDSIYPVGGGSFARVLPETEAAAWLARSLVIAASVGIERFYWFMWDGKFVGLTTWEGRKINAAGIAYGAVAQWLANRQVGAAQRNGNVVVVPLFDQGRAVARILWTQDYKTMTWRLPEGWNARALGTLDGRNTKIPGNGDVRLSASPLIAWL